MGELVESQDNITWVEVQTLFGFAFEHHLLSIYHSLFDIELQVAVLHLDLLPFAMRTHLVAGLALTFAFLASHFYGLHLSAQPNLSSHETSAVAHIACLHACQSISCAFANPADLSPAEAEH